MIAVNTDLVKRVQLEFIDEIENHRKKAVEKLIKFRKSRVKLSCEEREYLDCLISVLKIEYALCFEPVHIQRYIRKVGYLPPNSRKKGQEKLKDFIILKLNYKELRRKFYPKYFAKIGIKACVYCNSVLTVSTEKTVKGFSARFDVDHFYPKDKFPYLSIFLFNLYPSCAPCNRIKLVDTSLNFKLYSNNHLDYTYSRYEFKLDNGAQTKYLLSRNKEDLKFQFKVRPFLRTNDLQILFGIQEIYDTQKDIIEELILRSDMYNDESVAALRASISQLHIRPELFVRTLVGAYTKESEIHKRPLTKFTQDIARQLGLLKD